MNEKDQDFTKSAGINIYLGKYQGKDVQAMIAKEHVFHMAIDPDDIYINPNYDGDEKSG